jgi:hypothetical protein
MDSYISFSRLDPFFFFKFTKPVTVILIFKDNFKLDIVDLLAFQPFNSSGALARNVSEFDQTFLKPRVIFIKIVFII